MNLIKPPKQRNYCQRNNWFWNICLLNRIRENVLVHCKKNEWFFFVQSQCKYTTAMTIGVQVFVSNQRVSVFSSGNYFHCACCSSRSLSLRLMQPHTFHWNVHQIIHVMIFPLHWKIPARWPPLHIFVLFETKSYPEINAHIMSITRINMRFI